MNKKKLITRLGLVAMMFSSAVTFAQDVHFSQVDMTPLSYNPAFTGMFYGKLRANAMYRSQWNNITNGYTTQAVSLDYPMYSNGAGDYLANGIAVYNDKAGDGNLSSLSALVSFAYHKTFGGNGNSFSGSDLAVGLQGGYAQKSVDLTKLYFGDEFHNGVFNQGTTADKSMGNNVNYYIVNAGISFAQATGPKFSYVLGVSANNINQPNDNILKKAGTEAVLDMRLCGNLGIIWKAGDRLSLRPMVMYQTQASATELIAGNEFNFAMTGQYGETQFTPSIFVGGYLRNGDAMIFNAGFEAANFRVAAAYDFNISELNTVSNGNGGFEIGLRYISPYKYSRYRSIPCSRF